MNSRPAEFRRRSAPLGCALGVLGVLVVAGGGSGAVMLGRDLVGGADPGLGSVALLAAACFAAYLAGTLARRWTVLRVDRSGFTFQGLTRRKDHVPWSDLDGVGIVARRLGNEEAWWLAMKPSGAVAGRAPVRGAHRFSARPGWWLVAELDTVDGPDQGLAESVRRRAGDLWRGTIEPPPPG
jgi:hypothetical protein